MKKYKHAKQKKLSERAGFYVAMSVCLMAVGMAVWSAYTALSGDSVNTGEISGGSYLSSLSTTPAAVAQDMTGVIEAETVSGSEPTQAPTDAVQPQEKTRSFALSETMPADTEAAETNGDLSSMQAVLKVNDSLTYPVKSQKVIKEYSENSVYNKTMKDHRAHTGCDFEGEEGESVFAMSSGTVSNISVSELYGVIIEVDSGDYSVYYCGLDTDLELEENDEVKSGDVIGKVGHIPSESEDGSHVHIEIRVGDKLIDPLSVIGSNG